MATAEAMSFALPVVVTTSGASAELVDGGSAGIAVAPGEPVQLATAICNLLDDRRLATELGDQARARAERYSIRTTAAATLDFYRRLARQAA